MEDKIEYTQNSDSTQFIEAKKMITSVDLVNKFMQGKTYQKIIDFIMALQKSVEGKNKNDTPFPEVFKY